MALLSPPFRILVVDDEEPVRGFVCSVLSSAGYRHQQASDGLEALSLLESGERFDLLVTGLLMPRLDGISLLEQAKSKFPEMHAIMLTGVDDPGVRTAAFHRGADDFLLKPCDPEELLTAVRGALNERPTVKPRVFIADHEPEVGDWINSLLKDDGYDSMVVYSSADAVEIAPGFQPSLLVIDPIMPGVSGVEAASQIAKATHSKVLFLTTLASDRDFKELLRGLRIQGIECDVLPKPFTKEQLLSYVRREVGPAILQSDASEAKRESTSRQPGSGSAVGVAGFGAAAAREPLADFEPLLSLCTARVYETNAFRITGLNVDASLRDLAREAEKLEMASKLGVAHVHNGIYPPRIMPDTAAIKSAFQKLKDPEQRLLHEFFWFWPVTPASDQDEGLKALRKNNYEQAISLWKQAEKEDKTGVVTHNLAVYYHLAALEDELGNVGRGTAKPDISWRSSYKYWGRLLNHHAYWDRIVDRIKEIGDPRLTISSAERIWFSLPVALLSINAHLAVSAAERGDFEEAGRQRRLMFGSGLDEQQSRDALRRALTPLREELTRICSSAEVEARGNAKAANTVVQKLFRDKKRLLQAFNYLLGAGDQMRDAVFDLVAQTGRSCLIAYANETEDWATAQMLFEECLALAESKSLRARLEEDLEVIGGNLEGQRHREPQRTSPAATQSAPMSSPRAVPSSKPSNAGGWIALAVIGFFIVGGMIKGCEDDSASRATARPANSYTTTTPSVIQPEATPDGENSARQVRSYPAGSSWEITQLNSEIEANKSQLRIMEGDLQTSQEAIDGYKAQIDADKARLRQIERDNELGLAVDRSEYETIRQRHNSTVTLYNDGITEYNQKLAEYKQLLRTTNGKIERYNTLIRSR